MTSSPQPSPRAPQSPSSILMTQPLPKISFFVFSVATLLYWGSMYIYVPILSPSLQDRGLSMGWIGFILGSYGLTQMLVRLPLGMYSDAMSRRKPFLVAGMAASLISCCLFLLPGGWEAPLAARLVAGLCASAWVPFSVLFASYYPPDQTHRSMGTLSLLTAAGQLGGMVASGPIAEAGGWDAAFRTGIVLAGLGVIATLFVREPQRQTRLAEPLRDPLPKYRDRTAVLRSPSLWICATLSVLAHSILFVTMFGFTPLQATALGATKDQLTIIVAAFMIPHAILAFLAGRRLAPRFGTRNVIAVGFALSALFTLLIPACPTLWWLAITQALNGAAQALVFPLLLSLAIRGFAPDERATAMGLYQSVYSTGMFLGPYLAGGLNAIGGLKAGFWFASALGIAALVITLRSSSLKFAE